MATSKQIEQRIWQVFNQLQPLTSQLGKAPEYFRNEVNRAYQYNLPILKEGASLAEQMYTLPGQLMNKYDQEFGSIYGGASGLARLNSILQNLGRQSGYMQLADQLANQRQARMDQLANNLTKQYGLAVDALMNKFNMLSGMWNAKAQQEAAAAARAAAAAARRAEALQLPKLLAQLQSAQKQIQQAQQKTSPLTQAYVNQIKSVANKYGPSIATGLNTIVGGPKEAEDIYTQQMLQQGKQTSTPSGIVRQYFNMFNPFKR